MPIYTEPDQDKFYRKAILQYLRNLIGGVQYTPSEELPSNYSGAKEYMQYNLPLIRKKFGGR